MAREGKQRLGGPQYSTVRNTPGGSRLATSFKIVTRALSLLCPYLPDEAHTWVEMLMKNCAQWGGLTLHHEGLSRCPTPLMRGGPLCWHLTAHGGGGGSTRPCPGACVSTTEHTDTGA